MTDTPESRAKRIAGAVQSERQSEDEIRTTARSHLQPFIEFLEALERQFPDSIEEHEEGHFFGGGYSTNFYVRNGRDQAKLIKLYFGRSLGGGPEYVNIEGLDQSGDEALRQLTGSETDEHGLVRPTLKLTTPQHVEAALDQLERVITRYFR